jgi:SlyX protein
MSDERLVEIETQVAHQEYLLGELNDVVTRQQERIAQLESLCETLGQRLRSIGEALPATAAGDEKPPHY